MFSIVLAYRRARTASTFALSENIRHALGSTKLSSMLI